jgi:hypothetical protein
MYTSTPTPAPPRAFSVLLSIVFFLIGITTIWKAAHGGERILYVAGGLLIVLGIVRLVRPSGGS